MIKAATKDEATGRIFYVFGLSDLNLQKLREGKPIAFDLEPLGGKGSVMIMYGQTEAHIIAEIQSATRNEVKS
jgi:hypothetical protein